MLTVWEAIQTRRSIRKFVPDDVPDELVEQVLEAARLAPSASNRQPWRFVVVRDAGVKKEIRRICWGQPFIEEAPVVIVCFADLESYEPSMRGRESRYLAYLGSSPVSPRQQLLAYALANTFIAIEHLVLMATALGLGTCWVGGFDDASELNRLFGLSDNLATAAVVPVGYPGGELPPPRPRLELEQMLLKPQA